MTFFAPNILFNLFSSCHVTCLEGQQQQWQQLIHRGQHQLLRDPRADAEAPAVEDAVVEAIRRGEGHVDLGHLGPGRT